MGWVDLKLCIGLRVRNSSSLAGIVRGVLEGGTDPNLCIFDLSPVLEDTEYGPYDGRHDVLEEVTFEQCLEAEGWCLVSFGNNLDLDVSNGMQLQSGRCYSTGHLEFLNGDFTMKPLTEDQISVLCAVAEKLGIPYKLSWSLRARGSNGPSAVYFDKVK